MSASLHAMMPRCFPVVLGDLTFYAATWELTAVRQYAEQGSVTGTGYVTNASMRARKLVLEGYFPFLDNPAEVLLLLDAAIAANQRFIFSLRGIRYVAASLVEYTIREAAEEGVLPCRLALIEPNALTAVPETEGAE